MAILKSIAPTTITFIQNMSPNNVIYVQDAPESVDANNISTVTPSITPILEVGFGDLGGTLVGNVDIKLVYEDTNWIGAHVEMWENGAKKYESAVTYNGYANTITTFSFNSNLLADITGKNMRIRFVGHVYTGLTINYIKALRIVASVESIDPFLQAKTNWSPTDYYNFDDLNRVELMTEIVKEKVEEFRNKTITASFVSNRTKDSIEFAVSLRRIEKNILFLGNELKTPTGFIIPRTDWDYNQSFSFEDANRLEKNLVLLNNYVTGNVSARLYCGQYIVGDEGVS
jgi:hypothetical protein